MKPWPSLAEKACCLKLNAGDTIFYFDTAAPPTGGAINDTPIMVLIHGLGDEAESFRHLIPLLSSRGFRVLALDLPGFGRSIVNGKISVKNHANAVLKLIEAVIGPDGSKVFLAGNSLGAMVAETVVLKKPELIQGLILIDGSIPGGPSNPGFLVLLKLLLSRKWYRAYREDPEGAWASLYPYYADLDGMPSEDREFLRQRVMSRVESSSQEHAFFATQRSIVRTFITASSRFASGIQKYKGRILLIWGEKDRIIPLSSSEAFMKLRSDIELHVISGAGHLPQQEKPEETAQIMANFIAFCQTR
jgi:pimeloyl-ACP methyl ester carboxylesterase